MERKTMARRNRVLWLTIAGIAAAGVIAGIVVAVLPGGRQLPATRARVYLDVDACLLTGPDGIAVAPDSQLWTVMEAASVSSRVRVSYLAVTGPATEANAAPFLGTLLIRGCRVIVAADTPERAAVMAEATGFPKARFVVLGGRSTASNVTVLPASLNGLQAIVAGAAVSGT
jgi:hypothetical protein